MATNLGEGKLIKTALTCLKIELVSHSTLWRKGWGNINIKMDHHTKDGKSEIDRKKKFFENIKSQTKTKEIYMHTYSLKQTVVITKSIIISFKLQRGGSILLNGSPCFSFISNDKHQ